MARFMRLPFTKIHVFIAVLFLAAFSAQAQIQSTGNTTATPMPGAGHDYIHMLNETVNPANGSVSVRIELPTPKGRGATLPFSLAYDSNGVHFLAGFGGGGLAEWRTSDDPFSHGGWSPSVPRVSYANWYTQSDNGILSLCYYNDSYIFYDPTGNRHSLGLGSMSGSATGGGTPACTGLGAESYTNNGGYGDVYAALVGYSQSNPLAGLGPVTDSAATTYLFSGAALATLENVSYYGVGTIKDRNGNLVTATYSNTTPVTFTLEDDAGRTIVSSSPSGYVVDGLSFITSTTSVSASYLVPSIPLGGNPDNCTAPPTVSQSFNNVISTITVPGTPPQQYKFFYNNTYGLLSEIDYPDGGWIKYTWKMSNSDDGHFTELGTYPGINRSGGVDPTGCNFQYAVPVVATRQVGFGGSPNAALTQTFQYFTTWGQTSTWTQKATKVTSTDNVTGNSALVTYNYVPYADGGNSLYSTSAVPSAIPLESSILYYDWNNTSSPIRTVTKGWYNPQELACEVNTLENGQSSATFYKYYNTGQLAFAQVADEIEYDYGVVSPSACFTLPTQFPTAPSGFVRETATSYKTFTNPDSGVFIRPATSVVCAGGSPGACSSTSPTRIAETDYCYDSDSTCGGSSVTPASAIQQDTNYGPSFNLGRGNVTNKTVKCVAGSCTDSVTTYTYDQTGQILTAKDACGNTACADVTGTNHITTYSYSDNYSAGTPSGQTNAYLTQITDALGHTSKFAYDYNSGQLTQSQDQNDINAVPPRYTTYIYNDPLFRPKQINAPDGGQTNIAYDDSSYNATSNTPSVTTTKTITSTLNMVSTTAKDGMGHVVHTLLTSDPDGTTITDTTYDGMGRVSTQSNPHRASSASSDGTTTNTYDALGRPTQISKPDGSITRYSYAGNCTTVTDEASRVRKSCSDALGRLTSVFEDPNGLNYETDYTYDALSNLLSVTQKGGSTNSAQWRARTFAYDGLSRLLTATNPESGTIFYTYDANGNVATKVAPKPNQTGTATVTTTYGYDALNRLIQKSYDDGTPTANFYYDTAPAPWAYGEQNTAGRLVEATTGPTPQH
jgi:YD repeat-containing protein